MPSHHPFSFLYFLRSCGFLFGVMQRFERATAEGGKIGSFFLWAHSFLFEPRYPRSHLDMDYCLLVLFCCCFALGHSPCTHFLCPCLVHTSCQAPPRSRPFLPSRSHVVAVVIVVVPSVSMPIQHSSPYLSFLLYSPRHKQNRTANDGRKNRKAHMDAASQPASPHT